MIGPSCISTPRRHSANNRVGWPEASCLQSKLLPLHPTPHRSHTLTIADIMLLPTLFHFLAVNTLLLLAYPVTTATSLEGVDATKHNLLTTTSCQSYGFTGDWVAGLHYSDGQASCRCIPDDGGPNVCLGGASAACSSIPSDSGGESSSCTTCDPDTTCKATEATWLVSTSQCDSTLGQVLYFTKGNECSCESSEVLASLYGEPGYNSYTVCPAPENSYASCSVTLDFTSGHAEPGGRGCSFICLPDYQASFDGTGCVRSPLANPPSLRIQILSDSEEV